MFSTTRKSASAAIAISLILAVIIALASYGSSQSGSSNATSSSVYRFSDYGEVEGASSRLIRTEDAVAMELQTSGLEPNAPYTVWWVVFNTPEGCLEACDEDDLFNPDGTMNLNPNAGISILFADGVLTTQDGSASFSAVLPAGRTLGEVVVGDGLIDANAAEVHLVVRSHGPTDLSRLYEQLSTFEPHPTIGGDCAACQDMQFAVHQPISSN